MTIEERVRRLEAHCHRWRTVASLLAVLLIVTLCVGQTRPVEKNLEVESIRFRDEQGRVRMVIASTLLKKLPELSDVPKVFGDRLTGLVVLDENGKNTTSIINDTVMVSGHKKAAERTSFEFASLAPGNLAVASSGAGGDLQLTTVAGEKICVATNSVALTKDGCQIIDAKGTYRAILGTAITTNAKTGASTTSAPGALTLFDGDGKVLFQQP